MTDSKRYQSKIVFLGLLCALILLASCTSKPKESKDVRRYPIEGKVIAVNHRPRRSRCNTRRFPAT